MATEIRAKDDFRMMSPARDLKHCLVPMMKAATQLSELSFEDDEDKIHQLGCLVSALCTGVNEAKLPNSGTSIEVLQRLFKDIQDVDPNVRLNFLSFFLYTILARYITGLRETTTEEALSEQDIFKISTVAGMAAFLPDDTKKVFAETMRNRGVWGLLDAVSLFEIKEVPDESCISS